MKRLWGSAPRGRAGLLALGWAAAAVGAPACAISFGDYGLDPGDGGADRKSTRLNSSHLVISYAVFCLKKKKKYDKPPRCICTPLHLPTELRGRYSPPVRRLLRCAVTSWCVSPTARRCINILYTAPEC